MFKTPYNDWVRNDVFQTNMRYANRHAYANELYNSSLPLHEIRELMPPVKYHSPPYKRENRISDIMGGGLTMKAMEGGLDYRYGDDNKMGFSPAPFERTFGYGKSKPPVDSDSDASESDEETENRVIGGASTALPQKYMKSTGNSTIGPWIGTGKSGGIESAPSPNIIVSGAGAKKSSPWIAHVKKWCADHKMSYRDALRNADMKKAYHSSKKGGILPLLPMAASLLAPSAVKLVSKGVKSIWNKIRGKGKSGGILAGPSNDVINGETLAIEGMGHPLATFRKKMKVPKKVAMPAPAPAMPAPAMPAPVASGAGKRRSKKTGSSLFSIKGFVPMNVKDAPSPPQDVITNAGQVADPLPNEVQAAAIGKGGKKPRKPRAKKVCMPVDELVKEHKQLVSVLKDKSENHEAVMKKEAAKQSKELKKYKKMGGKKEDPVKKKARAPSKWIAHVQSYAKQHGISYKKAMSEAKSSYKV